MGFIDNLSEGLNTVGQGIGQKADIAQLNLKISETERKIQAKYTEIGGRYYAEYWDKQAPVCAQQIEEVTQLHREIEDYKTQIRTLKGVCLCPHCNAEVQLNARFCANCGQLMNEVQPTAEGRVCDRCGAAVGEQDAFCIFCGNKLTAAVNAMAQASEPAAEAAPTSSAYVPEEPLPVVPEYKPEEPLPAVQEYEPEPVPEYIPEAAAESEQAVPESIQEQLLEQEAQEELEQGIQDVENPAAQALECPNCHNPIDPEDVFCCECGARLK